MENTAGGRIEKSNAQHERIIEQLDDVYTSYQFNA